MSLWRGSIGLRTSWEGRARLGILSGRGLGTLALALVDVGREREAVSLALEALAPHLPLYQRSLANYSKSLLDAS